MRAAGAFLTVIAAALLAAGSATAADPIMPLGEVKRGMRCTGLSVIQGTAISSFDIEVLDVLTGRSTDDSRILFQASGPAVAGTGVGQGFSGSPIYCRDGAGTSRNIGAISESTGDYGNDVALATPIEAILGEPVTPPRAARRAPRLLASAHPLTGPLTVSGLSPGLRQTLAAAARRKRRAVFAVPAAPHTSHPPQQLVPGASVVAGLSAGDLAVGTVGTVAYTDGPNVWAFGHPLDGAGRRSLFLQDAYVYAVIDNPVGVEEISSYKLAAPGNVAGTVTNDALNAIVGVTGAPPPRIPLTVMARDVDSRRLQGVRAEVADETGVGLPAGGSPLALVGPLGVLEAGVAALRSVPAQHSGRMCVRVGVRRSSVPLRFCNRYAAVGGSAFAEEQGGAAVSEMASDLSSALRLIDQARIPRLRLTSARADLRLTRAAGQAQIISASGPRGSVRRGSRVRVTVRVRALGGASRRISFRLRVPRELDPGETEVELIGADAGDEELADVLDILLEEAPAPDEEVPRNLAELREGFTALQRYDGIRAVFGEETDSEEDATRVYRDSRDQITGRTTFTLRVAR